MLQLIGLAIILAGLSWISFHLVLKLLHQRGVVELNYKQNRVPSAYGLVFTLVFSLGSLSGAWLGNYDLIRINRLLILVLVMSLVGVIDDLIGSSKVQGLSGHFKVLFWQQRLTTGGLKAVFSGLIIITISLIWYQNLTIGLLNAVILLLSANLINLLDVKPGRALKGVLVLTGLILFLNPTKLDWSLMLLIGSLFALPFDLKQKAMMGDTGANVLGVTLGFLVVISFNWGIKLIWAGGLILIHIYTEFNSLSRLIADISWLNYFDQLGRR